MPTTGQHNLILVGDVYLTKDGLVTGAPCKTFAEGFDVFEFTDQVQDTRALDGTVHQQASELLIDQPVVIRAERMTATVKDSLQEVIEDYRATPTPFPLVLSNGPKDLTLTAKPRGNKPIEYPGTFSNDQLDDVRIYLYATLS